MFRCLSTWTCLPSKAVTIAANVSQVDREQLSHAKSQRRKASQSSGSINGNVTNAERRKELHTPWAGSEGYNYVGAQYRSGSTVCRYRLNSLPISDRKIKHCASTWLLPDTLQHSILSLWLRATQVGIAPTCFQTISSTHVHGLFCRYSHRTVLVVSRHTESKDRHQSRYQ